MQRWLTDLERAGLIAVEGERDNRGQWWRTVITLLEPPRPAADDLAHATERQRSWRRRARRRRRRARRQPERNRASRGRAAAGG